MAIFQIQIGQTRRLAVGSAVDGPAALLDPSLTLDGLLASGAHRLAEVQRNGSHVPLPSLSAITAPVTGQEIWASGVTYQRSRVARGEESRDRDHYDLVYEADRPELFLKCGPGRARGPGERIGVRRDSTWDVPEPELTLVLDAHGETAAFTIGNDVSSRSIEGENPLYLPQAKTYTGSCAIGPCLVLPEEIGDPMALTIGLEIERAGAVIIDERTNTCEMRRHVDELRRWLVTANEFPSGVLLMTGTGIVPGPDFSLAEGDLVHISIEGLGTLSNTVELVGNPVPVRQ